MNLTGSCVGSYPTTVKSGSREGQRIKMFVFKLAGSKEDLDQYVELQTKRVPKSKWVNENGEVFYWSSAPSGSTIKIVLTTNGNVVEDTTKVDLKAAENARYDATYESVKAGLVGNGSVPARVIDPAVTEPPVLAGSGAPLGED